ncbi:hypothetical protein SBA3_3030015 [Candidatus Sulfopaludibacter sp. SbA3]|nr:hypothetical protein SBA3_3030015 [Candidatus Sulfopaludibacter sp. SbA3]
MHQIFRILYILFKMKYLNNYNAAGNRLHTTTACRPEHETPEWGSTSVHSGTGKPIHSLSNKKRKSVEYRYLNPARLHSFAQLRPKYL